MHAADIYTCKDASGKQLVSDRPISSCIDREQKVLSNSAVVKKVVPPSYTAQEAAAIEARKKQAEQEALKAQARERSLVILAQRYPNSAAHQKARNETAQEILARIQTGNARLQAIAAERTTLDKEMEFYSKSPDKVPFKLRTLIKNSTENEAIARRYLDNQNKELAALHKRFDDEAALLATVWKKVP